MSDRVEIPEDFDQPCVALILKNSEITLVDANLYHDLNQYRWMAHTKKTGYCYAEMCARGSVYLHRKILGLSARRLGDHINGYTLDNRTSNLRPVTPAQNAWNRRPHNNSKSRVKGVYRASKPNRPYAAEITCNGNRRWLGYFPTLASAKIAYDDAARKLQGEFARIET